MPKQWSDIEWEDHYSFKHSLVKLEDTEDSLLQMFLYEDRTVQAYLIVHGKNERQWDRVEELVARCILHELTK